MVQAVEKIDRLLHSLRRVLFCSSTVKFLAVKSWECVPRYYLNNRLPKEFRLFLLKVPCYRRYRIICGHFTCPKPNDEWAKGIPYRATWASFWQYYYFQIHHHRRRHHHHPRLHLPGHLPTWTIFVYCLWHH
jgi:hypothetical protein